MSLFENTNSNNTMTAEEIYNQGWDDAVEQMWEKLQDEMYDNAYKAARADVEEELIHSVRREEETQRREAEQAAARQKAAAERAESIRQENLQDATRRLHSQGWSIFWISIVLFLGWMPFGADLFLGTHKTGHSVFYHIMDSHYAVWGPFVLWFVILGVMGTKANKIKEEQRSYMNSSQLAQDDAETAARLATPEADPARKKKSLLDAAKRADNNAAHNWDMHRMGGNGSTYRYHAERYEREARDLRARAQAL